ncbi:MAG: hypothetical protein RIT81_05470 [Deltaproteobacteria bacterium]
MRPRVLAIALLTLSVSAPAWAQDVPIAAEDDAVEPGFEEESAPAPPPRRRRRRRRPSDYEAVDASDPGRNEQFVELINATRGEISLGELIEEVLADVMAELDRRAVQRLSPMAIREISLGANVKSSYRKKLEAQLVAAMHAGTDIDLVECIECKATRTRIEDGKWIVTRGLVTTDQMREAGARLGAKTFLDVAFGFDPESGIVEMSFTVIRARDAQIMWAETFRADESTPMLMRASEAPVKRSDRLRDLEMLLEGRPFYGYMASGGFALLPYDDPMLGDISGATAGYRIYERFGEDRNVMFGLDLMAFFNPDRLSGGILSAGSWWVPIRPDLVNPELRIGAKAGAFIAGPEGNAAIFQLGAEVLLRYRFGLYAYVLFMTKSAFNDNHLGGVGFSAGISFNW